MVTHFNFNRDILGTEESSNLHAYGVYVSFQAGCPYGLFRDLLSNRWGGGGGGGWGGGGSACNGPCTILVFTFTF